jgi:hypothetical protein
MAYYLVRFWVATALIHEKNVEFPFKGLHPVFLFAEQTQPGAVIVQTKLQAQNNREA